MNITIINTSNKLYSKNDFPNHDVTLFNTTELKIKSCNGCFDCWVKTPGKCVIKDDMEELLIAIINSDLTVYISDIKVGYVSSGLKMIHDRTLPLILPYMDIVKDEVHHTKRYEKYPKLGLVLIENEKISDEVFDIIENSYVRLSYNMRTELLFVIKDDNMLGGLNNEISNY
ncbi:MAG: flavodoxin family protein [Candidatus Izimaplasma sp.]|nr:flavodoxin family protein [Candidatus Izimaplasma bacterium]